MSDPNSDNLLNFEMNKVKNKHKIILVKLVTFLFFLITSYKNVIKKT